MKLLIVRSSESSTWGSCRVISPNLQATYKFLENKFSLSWFDLPPDFIQQETYTSNSYIMDLSLRIKIDKPDQIIFIDHLPNPAIILNKLSLIMELDLIPPLVFHLYGDFTYFSKDWLELSPRLINHPVRFLAASSSQQKLLRYFCEDSSVAEKFCFPINSKEYFFDPSARKRLREELGISNDEIIIIYSGRVSLQKNVDILIKEYSNLISNSARSIHLWVVGAFDDLGAPFMGVETSEGYLFSKIEKLLASLPKEIISKIKFWGLQDKVKLRELKSAADLFISLSLYHDEDYGMSPAEAMATGLPSLLTDWGGYSSFASKDWHCQLIPVSITEHGLQIKTSKIKEYFDTHIEKNFTEIDRQKISNAFLNHFSIEHNTSILESILNSSFNKFKGFNWALAPFSELYGKSVEKKSFTAHTAPTSKNFYYSIYRNYISLEEMTNNDHSSQVTNWNFDYINNSVDKISKRASKKTWSYRRYLDPFSMDYYGPTNPVFLLDDKLSEVFREKKILTLRDGLLPIYNFFINNLPDSINGKIAIHQDFWFLVPEQWREKVYFYTLNAKNEFSANNLPQKIFISGIFDSALADPEDFDNRLAQLGKTIGKENLKQIEVMALFPNKKTRRWTKWQDGKPIKAIQDLTAFFEKEIHFCNWQQIQNENNFNNCLYFEINHAHFIKETFTKQFALSRGAGLLSENRSNVASELIKTYQLSNYHSINIYQPDFSKIPKYIDPIKNEYFDMFKSLYSNVQILKNSSQLDSWYSPYLKRYYRLYPPNVL